MVVGLNHPALPPPPPSLPTPFSSLPAAVLQKALQGALDLVHRGAAFLRVLAEEPFLAAGPDRGLLPVGVDGRNCDHDGIAVHPVLEDAGAREDGPDALLCSPKFLPAPISVTAVSDFEHAWRGWTFFLFPFEFLLRL
eukprot:CAMPEP_0206404320 /NCGR_PEP_ID=MMETSP0294-20121207/28294_1 /ASSEMBLY_ACC=CAM_ASM_000327 /TAXON_ID=39354 /ORGANISM="Heterosigma akashiwo, Strain CCMP2393" /LENGTH=137 /DNA_ID=CAMNT_0053862187 /DNA_START=97 /DNA_END=510 /DNA_ORIENTATION=+